ncbi:MAG: TIGR01777 family oxidoreductase [Zavarzinella sp.]
MRVVVTGGTGLIGKELVSALAQRGDEVVVFTRSQTTSEQPNVRFHTTHLGDDAGWRDEILAADAVIHLAGETIAGRWTKKKRARILQSRTVSTQKIAEVLASKPFTESGTTKSFITASGVGYYGSYTDNATSFIETDLPGPGFLADVCVQWEGATDMATLAGVRVANVRTGVVLSRSGGALPPMALPFRLFMGGKVASGKQWLSWIHLQDLVSCYLWLLDHPTVQGPVNAAAPEAITNWGFAKKLAKVLRRPCWLPIPGIFLRLLLGEAAELMTHGQRVTPQRLLEQNFPFEFPTLEPALVNLLKK